LGDHQPEPDDLRGGATRRTDRRRYRGTGDQGDLGIGQSAPPKDARFEATRSSIAGKAGDRGRRETGSLDRKRCGGSEENGATRRIAETGSAEGCEIRGNSKIHRRHSQRIGEAGQPAEAISRRGQRTRSTGQPGNTQLAKPEDAGAGETRNQHERLNGTMHDPMSYQDTRRAPEAARSLAFSPLATGHSLGHVSYYTL